MAMILKEIVDTLARFELVIYAKYGSKAKVEIVGSGEVDKVVIEKDTIYIIGENTENDAFLNGYKEAVEYINEQYQRSLDKAIADMFIPEPPGYDFKRDYHGQFKKKDEEV